MTDPLFDHIICMWLPEYKNISSRTEMWKVWWSIFFHWMMLKNKHFKIHFHLDTFLPFCATHCFLKSEQFLSSATRWTLGQKDQVLQQLLTLIYRFPRQAELLFASLCLIRNRKLFIIVKLFGLNLTWRKCLIAPFLVENIIRITSSQVSVMEETWSIEILVPE